MQILHFKDEPPATDVGTFINMFQAMAFKDRQFADLVVSVVKENLSMDSTEATVHTVNIAHYFRTADV